MRRIGVCYRTSWRIKHKLMQVMHERESTTKLADRVEIDDSYLGGERVGGKSGRGSENKIPFIAAIETNSQGHPKRAIFTPVKTFSSAEVKIWAQKYLKDTAIVVSDGLGCFRAVKAANCKHRACKINCVNGHSRLQPVTTGETYDHSKRSTRFTDEGLQKS